ncbi:PUM2 [Symbiodinium natans]|uniref:PUM2 protein n=1 Tax=Symbiodinium natans TaxID=878477 RepID=A0A812R5Y4_9DINO|nr:PUM2 [Symbiodinium natans]
MPAVLMCPQPALQPAVAFVVNVQGGQPMAFAPNAVPIMAQPMQPMQPVQPVQPAQLVQPTPVQAPCKVNTEPPSPSTPSCFSRTTTASSLESSSTSSFGLSERSMTPVELFSPTPEGARCSIRGRVWQLCQQQNGCRRVQEAIDACSSDQDRHSLAFEMVGHVWEAARCPFGNYVLQKFITVLRPPDCQFIVDEISSRGKRAASQLARHRYGCRIMQRLLEHVRQEQASSMVEGLLGEALQLARHQYGNFVMQCVLSHGTLAQQRSLCLLLKPQACELAMDQNASAVLAKALRHVSPEDKVCLANGLLSKPGLLLAMSKIRHGHQTTLALFRILEGDMLESALNAMRENFALLSRFRYGRVVLRGIPALNVMCSDLPREEIPDADDS